MNFSSSLQITPVHEWGLRTKVRVRASINQTTVYYNHSEDQHILDQPLKIPAGQQAVKVLPSSSVLVSCPSGEPH